jgi:ethanolamine utilization protein EutP (predicted NTPase)
MIKTKAKVNNIAAIQKIKARRAKNNAKILAMIEAPQIAIVTPAIINKTKVIIFLPRK